LYDASNKKLVEKSFATNAKYCFPKGSAGCWRFVIEDREKNGLCCSHGRGWYKIFWNRPPNDADQGLIHKSNFAQKEYEVVIGCKDVTKENPTLKLTNKNVTCQTLTEDNQPCLFPFKDDKGKLHHECALEPMKNPDYSYCATITNADKSIARKRPCANFNCQIG